MKNFKITFISNNEWVAKFEFDDNNNKVSFETFGQSKQEAGLKCFNEIESFIDKLKETYQKDLV